MAYPPRDPVADFFARQGAPPVQPRPRTVAEELDGTIFADPVKDFFVSRWFQPTDDARRAERDRLKREGFWASARRSPLGSLIETAETAVRHPRETLSGFVEGAAPMAKRAGMRALEDAAGMGKFILTPAGQHGAEIGTAIGKRLTLDPRPLGRDDASTVVQTVTGIDPTGDLSSPEFWVDALFAAGGARALGQKGPRIGPKPRMEPRAPREVFENGNVRPPDVPHPPVVDEFADWLGMKDASAADPLDSLFAGPPRLPARGTGPITPEPTRGSIAAVPPVVNEASRWQRPQPPPEPPVAPPAPDPLADLLAQPDPPPSRPAVTQPPVDRLAAERAQLAKQGFPPELIDLLVSQKGTPVDPVTGRRPITMPEGPRPARQPVEAPDTPVGQQPDPLASVLSDPAPPAPVAEPPPVPAGPTLLPRQRSFVKQRLNWTDADIDADPAGALAAGMDAFNHPRSIKDGITQYAKPKPQPPVTEPPAAAPVAEPPAVTSDPLADLLNGPRTVAEPTAPDAPTAPQPAPATVRPNIDAPPVPPERAVLRSVRENPTPENSKALEDLHSADPEKFWQAMKSEDGFALIEALASPSGRAAVGGIAGAVVGAKADDDPLAGFLKGGAIGAVGAGVGPQALRFLSQHAPMVAQKLKETLPPALGGTVGAPIGRAGARLPRNRAKDIWGTEQYLHGQPHRTVPDVWKEMSPVLADMAADEKAFSVDPKNPIGQVARNIHVKEMGSILDRAIRQATSDGHTREAKYLGAMSDELNGVPIKVAQIASDFTNGLITAKQFDKAMHRIEQGVYVQLLGAALDTAMVNTTQLAYVLPHVGFGGLWEGLKLRRTPQGKAATGHLRLDAPTDAPLDAVKNATVRAVVKAALSPLRATDQVLRETSYLAAQTTARRQGLTPEQAHEFAIEITAQTQGVAGPFGANPFHRQLGPLRMFTKYPAIWSQWFLDMVKHPDPGVRRRAVGMMLGFGAVQGVTGISMANVLFPRVIPTFAAWEAGKDLVTHATGTADHALSEDIDPRRGGSVLTGRYPAKVAKEVGHFMDDGASPHTLTNPQGDPRGEHSATEGVLSLLGLKTERELKERKALDEAYDWIADESRKRNITSRLAKQDLQRAIERGDDDEKYLALAKLTPAQRRAFMHKRSQTRFDQLRAQVPVAQRAEFDKRFKARFSTAAGQ